jgi:hypothetical protein
MSKKAFDSTRLQAYATGHDDKLKVGMRVCAEDVWGNHDACTITEITREPTRNIRAVDSQGNIVLLNIWQVKSTLPASTSVADILAWADA